MKDHMKTCCKAVLVCFIVLMTAVSCEKEVESSAIGSVVETPEADEVIGTYEYDGKSNPVKSVSCVADDVQIYFKLSPIADPEPQTTYAVVGINAALEGVEIDVARAWHNDDYYFIYEDPVMYYSQYRKLTSGTIFIMRHGDLPEDYEIFVDIVLPDGKKFHFEQK